MTICKKYLKFFHCGQPPNDRRRSNTNTFSKLLPAPNGELLYATPRGQQGYPTHLGYYVKGFGQDNRGEVYVTVTTSLGPSGNTGKVFKIVKIN